MKKTILKTTMLAAIASLTMSGYVSAHHPSEDVNPNFATVDEQISDQHNIIIDAMLEDGDFMGGAVRAMDSNETPTVAGGDAISGDSATTSQTSNQGMAPNVNQAGMSNANAAKTGR